MYQAGHNWRYFSPAEVGDAGRPAPAVQRFFAGPRAVSGSRSGRPGRGQSTAMSRPVPDSVMNAVRIPSAVGTRDSHLASISRT